MREDDYSARKVECSVECMRVVVKRESRVRRDEWEVKEGVFAREDLVESLQTVEGGLGWIQSLLSWQEG
ncbi:hypothetical protein COLO4_35894 [Corchorus olitorius]|uniref:Uncharacterized protein n=1 Tax=Corchorus olitorius TaxID=93759 RepID=A0A1R3GC86_9ROSI|nr:hypothetical protein COLO4_35894 [Corchorus olitorius]